MLLVLAVPNDMHMHACMLARVAHTRCWGCHPASIRTGTSQQDHPQAACHGILYCWYSCQTTRSMLLDKVKVAALERGIRTTRPGTTTPTPWNKKFY
jgi:hypothetical protein